MGMLDKICDVKNTLQGKALAVFVSLLLAFSMVNLSAFADAADDASSDVAKTTAVDPSADEAAQDAASEPSAPVEEPQVQTPAQSESAAPETPVPSAPETPEAPVVESPAAPEQSAAPEPVAPEAPAEAPAVEPGVAVVALDFQHAYVKYLDQTIALPTETVKAPLNKELAFTAHADEGYEIERVRTVVEGVETELVADEQTGEYKVPADQVTSKLTLEIVGKAVKKESMELESPKSQSFSESTSEPSDDPTPEQSSPREEVATFTNFALRSASLSSVPVAVEFTDAKGEVVDSSSALLPAGIIADNAPGYEGYSFKHAVVDNNPVVFAGVRDGTVYYTAEGALDSGIAMRLEEGKTIKLVYEPYVQKHAVSYNAQGVDDQAGNTFEGPAFVRDGEDLSFRVDVAYGYTVSVECNGEAVTSDNYIYSVSNVTSDVAVDIAYTKNTTFDFKVEQRDSVNWHGAYFDRDGTYPIPGEGEAFTFKTTSPRAEGYTYQLNALTINGETVDIPAVSLGSLGMPGKPSQDRPPVPTATTVLSTGVEVTVTLIRIIDYAQFEYEVSLKGVKGDVTVTPGNYRASSWQEVMPRYTPGVVLEHAFIQSDSADEVARNGSFSAVKNYLPIATADSGNGQVNPWFRAKLMDGYENLSASLDDWTVLGYSDTHAEVIDGWLYFKVVAVGNGTQDPYNLRNLSVSADLVNYSVAYDTNGGSAAPVDNASYDYVSNKQLLVSGTVPAKDGNLFLGWKLDGSDDTYLPGQVLSIEDVSAYAGAGNKITFTAQWASTVAVGTPLPVEVRYYYMQSDGQYPTTPDRVSSVLGHAGAWIEKWNASEEAPEGLTFDKEKSTVNARVSSDPAKPTILELYYSTVTLYSVTYDLAGGVTESPTTSFTGIESGASTPTIEDPTRAGYTFIGWDKEIAPTVTDNVTYTAQWKRNPVQYVYSSQAGGSVSLGSESIDPVADTAAGSTASADPGYVLDGWYSGDTKITNENAAALGVELRDGGMTVVPVKNAEGVYAGGSYEARWSEAAPVALVYEARTGGSVTDKDGKPSAVFPESVKPVSGTPTGSTAIASKGYVFKQWTVNGEPVSDQALLSLDVINASAQVDGVYRTTTFVAEFEESADVTISYTAGQGGTVDPASEVLAPATGSAQGSAATPGHGYEFVNWTTMVDGEEEEVSTSSTLSAADVDRYAKTSGVYEATTFTAHFAEEQVVISYEATAGGSVSPASNTVGAWASAVPGSAASAEIGHYLIGWSVKGSEEIISTATTIDTSVVERYAKDAEGAFAPTTFVARFAEKTGITVTADSREYVYNGQPRSIDTFTYNVAGSSEELTISGVEAHGEGTAVAADGYEVAFSNTRDLVIRDAAGEDVTRRYQATFVEGTLTITPRPINLTGDGWEGPQEYIGTAYAKDTYTVEGADASDERGLVNGHRVSASYAISGTTPGTYEGAFDTIGIFDNAGNDVTPNYTVATAVGSLEIVASSKPLVITAASHSWKYDGVEHSDESYTVTYGGVPVTPNGDGAYILPTGDEVSATVEGAVTNVGDTVAGNNEVTAHAIANQGFYGNVVVEDGSLAITPREVTLTSGSAEKSYDGTPLTDDEVTVSGDGFVADEGAEYQVTGTRTAVGFSDNTFEYTLKAGTLAENYDIEKSVGTLTVTSREEGAKYEIDLVANSGEFPYDGTERTVSGFKRTEFTFGGATFTVTGLDASATRTDAGTSDVIVSGDPTVTDGEGNVVTDQFVIHAEKGTLLIKQRPLTLTSATLSKPYDGTPLMNGDTPLDTEQGWVEGEGAAYTFSGSVLLAGENAPNAFEIVPNEGTDLRNYEVSKAEGQLTITNRDALYGVTVTAESLTAKYDGTQKTVSGFEGQTDQGVPVQADGRTYYVKGLSSAATGTNVADSVASIPVTGTAQVLDGSGNDVSSQFDVTVNPGTLAIEKRPLTLTSATLSKPYDGTPLANGDTPLAAEEGWAEGEGAAYTFSRSVTLPGATAPNAFAIVPNAGTDLGNYEVSKAEGQLTVTNRDAAYEVEVTANTLTTDYNGEMQSVSGFVGQTDQGIPVQAEGRTYYVTGLTAGAQGTDADNYPVTVSGTVVVVDADGNDVTEQFEVKTVAGFLTINQRPLTLTSATLSKPYDGTPLANGDTPLAAEEGWAEGEGAMYTFSGSVLLAGESAPNAFAIVPNAGTDLGNYEVSKAEGQLTVTNRDEAAKYALDLVANSGTFLYDGTQREASGFERTEFIVDGATFTVEGLVASAARTDAGETTVGITGTLVVRDAAGNDVTDQFNVTPVPGKLTVQKRSVTLTSASDEKPYDGTPLTNDEVTVAGDGFAAGEGAAFTVIGSQTVVGHSDNTFTYALTNGAKADNYTILTHFGTLTVIDRDTAFEVSVEANSRTELYDGSEKLVSGLAGETDQGVPVTAGGLTYYVSGLTASAARTDVGTTEVAVAGTPVVTDADGNVVTEQFNVKTVSGTLKVQPRVVNLTSASATKAYDGQPLVAHDVIVSGDMWAAGEGATYEYTGSQTLVGSSLNEFSYTLNEGTKASNYTIKPVKGTLTVNNRDAKWNVTVTAKSATTTYDGAQKAVSGFEGETDQGVPVQVEGSTFYVTGLTAQAVGTDANTYPVQGVGTPKVLDAAGNDVSGQFNITVDPGLLTIEKRKLVLESASAVKPYDGTPLTAHSVNVTGEWAAGEGADYAFSGMQTLVGSSSNGFTYQLIGGAKASNYDIESRYGSLTVTNRDAAYEVTVQANSLTKTYDGDAKSVSGFKNESDQGVAVQADGRTYYVVGLTAQATGTDAGTYTANVVGVPAVKDAEGNDVTAQFAVKVQNGSLVIDKRPLTLASADLSKPYDGRPLVNGSTPLAIEDGWVQGQGAAYVFTGSVALPGETAPNAFAVKVNEGTNLENYALTKTEGRLTIDNRDAAYEIEVTANSGTFTYDGAQKTVGGFVGETGYGIPVQVDGRTYYVTGLQSTASGTDVIDSFSSIPVHGTPAVVDADGNVVTSQFNVKVVPGSLTIQPAALTIKADDTGKRYGDGDPALTATVSGLAKGDVFEGTYEVTRAPGENAGSYEVSVGNVQMGAGGNYTVSVLPGTFVIAPRGEVTFVVNGGSKPYDGTPLTPNGFTPIGLAPGDTVEVVYGGSQTDAGTSEGTIVDYIIRNAAGEDVGANYPNVVIAPGELTVTPALATIVVDDASKVVGAADPAFTGTVSGLVAPNDLGAIAYSRTGADESVGVYEDVLVATFAANPNYTVTFVPGTFTIAAAAVVPPVPTTPTTPTTPGTTPTAPVPTPLPAAPGTPPADNPVTPFVAPVVDALQDAVETVIGPVETPLAGPEEVTIDDDGNPLAGYDRVNCWVHYYLILGIIVTLLYGAGVLVRRMRYTHVLKNFEDDVLGVEDESAAAPAASPYAGKEA